MQATPLPYAGIDVEHPFKEGHDILFDRLHEESKPVFAEESTVSRRTVSHAPLSVDQCKLVSYRVHFFITFQMLFFVESACSFLTVPFLTSLFPMPSIMFSRMICDLSPFTSQ